MKTAKQWVDETSQSGAFDLIVDCDDAELLIKKIQADAMERIIQHFKELLSDN